MPARSIRELIEEGTKSSLDEALTRIENETDCSPLSSHPLFKSFMEKILAQSSGLMEAKTVTA